MVQVFLIICLYFVDKCVSGYRDEFSKRLLLNEINDFIYFEGGVALPTSIDYAICCAGRTAVIRYNSIINTIKDFSKFACPV